MSFASMWSELEGIGRCSATGGYRRFAWTREDALLREWFTGECALRGLDVTTDRAGNQWAWWGDPDAAVAAGRPGVVTGSHLDSVPDGGAFDGPLGVVSALAAIDVLRDAGFRPSAPVGVVNFVDEEGARFGVACAGSRIITGALSPDRARGLRDVDGVSMAEAHHRAGRDPRELGADRDAVRRIGAFVELHVEQGRGLGALAVDAPVAVGTGIWPHGRWRIELPGEANHAGTTRLEDRRDAMLALARVVLLTRAAAERHGTVATIGKVHVQPGGVNAIASAVTAWLDARGADENSVHAVVRKIRSAARELGGDVFEDSWTPRTVLDVDLAERLGAILGGVPLLGTGAGHDAGVLAQHGVPAGMLFVRNPSGISHSPAEWAEQADCLVGVTALAAVLRDLSGDAV